MKTGQVEKLRDFIRSAIDPIFGVQYRFPKYTHLFLPLGPGKAKLSIPPHEKLREFKITGFEISGRKVRLIHPVSNYSYLLPIRSEVIDYPFRDCKFIFNSKECKKLREIALNEHHLECPGCDRVKYRVCLWQIPPKSDEHPWLCKRIDPFTGKIFESTKRYCKFCHNELFSSPRVKFCSPVHRYEHQKAIQKERRQIVRKISIKRCKHCGGLLTGRQRDWCGDRCRKIDDRKKITSSSHRQFE